MAQISIPPHPPDLDPLEIEILDRRDAFSLPPKETCDTLVKIFFDWIAPILPVVNRQDFMRKYHSPDRLGPPILLLQAMLMVAARFMANQQSSNGWAVSPRVFYKKAKALYNAGYERDPVTILQAVILLGIYWDGPDGESFDEAYGIGVDHIRPYRVWRLLLESARDCSGAGIRISRWASRSSPLVWQSLIMA